MPHQLAIVVAILYAIDTTLSNSRRLVSITQARKAFEAVGIKVATTIETAINQSDLETLQALSPDEDKLKIAMQHIKA